MGGDSLIEKLRFTFTPNGKREFVPRDQVFSLIVVYYLLLLLKNKWFPASFILKNCSGQFLSAYFLFLEILNLNLPFAVNVNLGLSNFNKHSVSVNVFIICLSFTLKLHLRTE